MIMDAVLNNSVEINNYTLPLHSLSIGWMLHRYTWYSNDDKTRKILHYVLTESYVQQYISDCRVKRDFNVDCLLQTTLFTPMTRQARKRYCKILRTPKVNIIGLNQQ